MSDPLNQTTLSADQLRAANYFATLALRGGESIYDGKQLAAYLLLARSVFESALEAANRSESTEDKNAYLTAAYMTAYNIASNTWPGWNEGDIDEEHRQVGLSFANIHMNIVAQLDLPPEKRASAFWLGAAHELAVKNYDAARSLYEKAKMLGEEGDNNEVALMNQGWMLVVDILQGNKKAESELEGLQQRLAGLSEDGEFYAGQFNDALEVFGD